MRGWRGAGHRRGRAGLTEPLTLRTCPEKRTEPKCTLSRRACTRRAKGSASPGFSLACGERSVGRPGEGSGVGWAFGVPPAAPCPYRGQVVPRPAPLAPPVLPQPLQHLHGGHLGPDLRHVGGGDVLDDLPRSPPAGFGAHEALRHRRRGPHRGTPSAPPRCRHLRKSCWLFSWKRSSTAGGTGQARLLPKSGMARTPWKRRTSSSRYAFTLCRL